MVALTAVSCGVAVTIGCGGDNDVDGRVDVGPAMIFCSEDSATARVVGSEVTRMNKRRVGGLEQRSLVGAK